MNIFWTFIFVFIVSGLYAQQTDQATYAYRANDEMIATEAPRHSGEFFRVELLTTSHFNKEDPALKKIQQHGTLRTEYLIDRETTRLLLGDFFEIQNAEDCLDKVKAFGLQEAKIIRYQKGYRAGVVRELKS